MGLGRGERNAVSTEPIITPRMVAVQVMRLNPETLRMMELRNKEEKLTEAEAKELTQLQEAFDQRHGI